jgi:hypothetical protein
MVAYQNLTMEAAIKMMPDSDAKDLLQQLAHRKATVREQHDRFRTVADRMDRLYYANDIHPEFGADLWASHPSATTPGYSHVSINNPQVYVDIPAALQAVPPIENMVATDTTKEARDAAAAQERIYFEWKREEDFDLKFHKAMTAKEQYGRTAARVYWDEEEKRPCVEIIDQPRHLYLGWKSDEYDDLYWAAYLTRMSCDAVLEEFSVELEPRTVDGQAYPYVVGPSSAEDAEATRPWLTNFGSSLVEVWDYWFLKPRGKTGVMGKKTKMDTWNAVFVGNHLVRYTKHAEYDGELPIKPLFNTYIPGVPEGRPALYDLEQLLREKMERVTNMAQMISFAAAGQYWQITGPEAPAPGKVNPQARPKLNELVSSGPGNRIDAIQPYIPVVQTDQYLSQIDQEIETISGLNPLLVGRAPLQALQSSKAINALIANYETRISIKRALAYEWREEIWELCLKVWKAKDADVRDICTPEASLDIMPPSLNPRDELETATRVVNLKNAGLWSQLRAMDAVGVDDPETEQNIIREENTDATLSPEKVQVMVQLLTMLQQVGQQAPPGVQQQAQQAMARGQNDLRSALAGATPANTTSDQLAGDQGMMPPAAGTPPPGGGLPMQAPPQNLGMAQTMLQGGQAKSRILTQAPIPAPGSIQARRATLGKR